MSYMWKKKPFERSSQKLHIEIVQVIYTKDMKM